MRVHCGNIHKSQKVEMIQISMNLWMEKQNVAYPYNEILLIQEKKKKKQKLE